MSDKTKTCLAILFFLSTFILPVVGLAVGWIGWDFRTGAMVGLVTFAVFFLLAGILLASVKELSWLTVGLPMGISFIYCILPDIFIGPLDDTVVFTAGTLLTFALWLRKQPETPKWIIFPLIISSLYTLVGAFIPGPIDELLVTALGVGIAGYGSFSRQLESGQEMSLEENEDIFEEIEFEE